MSSWNSMLSWVEHEKSFITSGQTWNLVISEFHLESLRFEFWEQKFLQMILVTQLRWPPRPYMVNTSYSSPEPYFVNTSFIYFFFCHINYGIFIVLGLFALVFMCVNQKHSCFQFMTFKVLILFNLKGSFNGLCCWDIRIL